MLSRVIRIAAIIVAVIAALTVGLFSYAATRTEQPMVGVVTASGSASIEATGQLGATATLKVDRIVAPDRSWVAVYLIGANAMEGPGGEAAGQLVGYAHVPAGGSRNVMVPLDTSVRLTEKVLVVLQADRGVRGSFEYDATRFEASPDKPYYVGGSEVSVLVLVRFNEMN